MAKKKKKVPDKKRDDSLDKSKQQDKVDPKENEIESTISLTELDALVSDLKSSSNKDGEFIKRVENERAYQSSLLGQVNLTISGISETLKNSFDKFKKNIKDNKLPTVEVLKLRNSLANLKKIRKALKNNLKELVNLAKNYYRRQNKSIALSMIRDNAKEANHHKRFGTRIKGSISSLIAGTNQDVLNRLRDIIAKEDEKEATVAIVKFVQSSNEKLYIRMVSNSEYKVEYVDYFKTELINNVNNK